MSEEKILNELIEKHVDFNVAYSYFKRLPTYFVGKDKEILCATKSKETLNKITDALCDVYEDMNEGSHEVYVHRDGKYYYSHATWYSGSGEVASRGISPMKEQTQKFIERYGDSLT